MISDWLFLVLCLLFSKNQRDLRKTDCRVTCTTYISIYDRLDHNESTIYSVLCCLMNWRPSLTRKQYRTRGDPVLHLSQARGIWTDARVCLHYWVVIWVAGYHNRPLYCTIFWVRHGQDTFGLEVVFWFWHFTASHYYHYAIALTGVDNL